jgi:hypothetical protein
MIIDFGVIGRPLVGRRSAIQEALFSSRATTQHLRKQSGEQGLGEKAPGENPCAETPASP